MKTLIPLTALAALVASGTIHAQTPAFSKPSGYTTQALSQGTNLVGISLQTPSIASGKFESITSTTLTDNEVTYSPISGRTYILEMTSGSQVGSIFEVPAANISGSTITITTVPATNLTTLGLTTNDTYNLRVAPTLVDIFSLTPLASGGVLHAALNVANSDIVFVPVSPGVFERYFLRSSGGFQRVTGSTTFVAVDGATVPLVYADGILIQKKQNTPASLTITGEVKLVGTNGVLTQGYNLVNLVAPVGLTLRTANLITSPPTLASALNVANSDIVWVQKANLTFDRYYYHSSGNWRNADTNVNLPALTDPAIAGAIYIQKKGTTPLAPLRIGVPSSYSGL
jgi:hypothetical protein